MIAAGIIVECVFKADIGYLLMSGSSFAIALGSLIFAKLTRGEK